MIPPSLIGLEPLQMLRRLLCTGRKHTKAITHMYCALHHARAPSKTESLAQNYLFASETGFGLIGIGTYPFGCCFCCYC